MFNRCNFYKPEYFFSFQDLLQGTPATQKAPFNLKWTREVFQSTGIETIIPSVIFSNYDYNYNPQTSYILRAHISDLFQRLYAKYWKEYVFALEEDSVAGTEYNNAKNEFYTKVGTIIMATFERYNKLLDVYTSELSKLLDGVKSSTTGVGRFNDTPQNITDGDEFGDNTHISNITKSTAEAVSDVDTKINRIDEIQRKLRNIWKDWVDEFDGLFIERGNI